MIEIKQLRLMATHPTHRLVVVAITSFLGGVLLVGSAAYVGFSRYLNDQFISSFYASAARAQFEVRALSDLRNGKTEKVVADLDLLLNSHTMQLANYETIVALERREAFVYSTLAEVRVYRAQFPTYFDHPLQQETFQKALDLGKKPGG